jgi:hypothetical protein
MPQLKQQNNGKAKFGHVRILPRSKLKPSPENEQLYRPVNPDDPAVLELADSIRVNGFKGSLVISRDNFILSGHRRYVAAGLAGLDELPCTVDDIYRTLRPRFPFTVNPEFVRRLETYNRQREKTLDEMMREAVVKADPEDAHRVLSEHRQTRAGFDSSNTIELRGFKRRAEISPAKIPFVTAVINILESLKAYLPLSVRHVHYELLNDPPLRHASKKNSTYSNDKQSYKDLTDLVTRMRLDRYIPFDWISDETRPISILTSYENAGAFLTKEMDGLLKGYYRDLLQSQPNHIEIMYEKLTGRSFIEPIALNYCLPLTIGRGFCSLPPRVAMAGRYRASGKEKLIILAMSDLDPDGDEITQSFARSMRDDFAIDVECIKAALTMDQVKEREIAPNKLEAKAGSASYPRYVERYGTNEVWELEALGPAAQRALLEEAILSVLDIDAYNYEVTREKEEAAFLDERRQRVLLAIGAE